MPRRLLAVCLLLVTGIADAGVYDDTIQAARNNDTQAVIDLVERGMDVNTSDRAGNTLLMLAAGQGNEALVGFLLKNRANARQINRFGDSALNLAALHGHLGVVRQLIEAGGYPQGKGWMPLHYGAYAGQAAVVELLVEQGVPLDSPAPNGKTALMLAAKNGHRQVVRILLEAGADAALRDPEGQTALDLAEQAGNSEIVSLLRLPGGEQ